MQDVYQENITCKIKEVTKIGTLSLTIPAVSMIYPKLNQLTGEEQVITTFIDDIIPFNKYFVLPYISWYAYVAFFLFSLCILDKERYFKLLISLNVGMIICYGIYYFYPTYVPRPFVEEEDIFDKLVLWVYKRDNPYNCMPSIHVLNSLLVVLYVGFSNKVKMISLKVICIIIGLLIILSTMFMKQHHFIDVITAIALSVGLYFFINKLWNIRKKH
ncbi:phosphatase PAP2 family protein [Clostridium aestuarii]|uniref:Phosphatase PAP2 family protein n=1 Tax=Clostridium aestuarii TaxID=338193 RepID=A0ABT4D368_9CLOT|nr:phosphatase PAP2 family protein [Clostridium aestuarii]MCY6485687.1 phosphatase PAP2 family protein [Clostridium aestuarii]